MPGRQWSLQEEQYYWDHVVPHSRYRIGIDRATNLEQTWGDLAAQMQAALGSDARRDYTALGLEEHFYLNVMQRGRSSRFARRFASRYHTQYPPSHGRGSRRRAGLLARPALATAPPTAGVTIGGMVMKAPIPGPMTATAAAGIPIGAGSPDGPAAPAANQDASLFSDGEDNEGPHPAARSGAEWDWETPPGRTSTPASSVQQQPMKIKKEEEEYGEKREEEESLFVSQQSGASRAE